MPVLDEQATILAQLAALAQQRYDGAWELVVVDNGCSDRSMHLVEQWRAHLPGLTIVDARSRRGLNYARERGTAAARGDFLAFCDADDVVTPGWLAALTQAARDADVVGGPLDFEELNDELRQVWWPRSRMTGLRHGGYGFLHYAAGGNCGIWTDVARAVGWDQSFAFGSSDIEFSWRAQAAGYRVGFAPGAIVRHRYRPSLRGMLRQQFAYGYSEALLYRRFRGSGLPPSSTREALRRWGWLVRRGLDLVGSRERRGRWLVVAAHRCGRLAGTVRWRVVFL
jgi:glycosyltransferase involved in cell wall biosynthesis